MDWLLDPQAWIALTTLTVMEIVLGIDNIVFISILAGKLPEAQRPRARTLGLAAAMGMRILLLLAISWIAGLVEPLFTVFGRDVSVRDLILLAGGMFLLAKATHEIHSKLEVHEEGPNAPIRATFQGVLIQIVLLDIVFSIDSVLTAIGMAEQLWVMVTAVVISVIVMMFFAGPIGEFVERHPTVKMLALSFLLLIGMALVAEGVGFHIPKGYIYFAMGFSMFVEVLNLRLRGKGRDVASGH